MWRSVTRIVAVATVLVTAGLGGGGWYYSDELLPVPTAETPEYVHEVTATDPLNGTITIATTDGDLAELDDVGLMTERGHLVVEGPPQRDETTTTRSARLVGGTWPQSGDLAAASVETYSGDPAEALAIPYVAIDVPSNLGQMPAWSIVPSGATPGTWAVIVHGRDSGLAEGNRLLPTLRDLSIPSLTVSVRNDPGAPDDPDGFGYYGDREWEDVDAAIEYLRRAEDVERVVLIGFSHGGSTVLSYLRHSSNAHLVHGAVLVSPLISLHETFAWQARDSAVPNLLIRPLLAATGWVCTLRAGLDFDELEHRDHIDELPTDVPMLITHGTADAVIPIDPTREFAAALGSQAIFEEYEDVGHGREWNADRDRFEADLRGFLADTLADDDR